MTLRRMVAAAALLALALLAAACGDDKDEQSGIPNPASVFCAEQGGTLEIVTAADCSQSGVCHFTDGSQCEEWAFFRGECAPGDSLTTTTAAGETGLPNPASVFCIEQGWTLEIRDEAGGQAGYCMFADGSECEEWAFFRGECSPGN